MADAIINDDTDELPLNQRTPHFDEFCWASKELRKEVGPSTSDLLGQLEDITRGNALLVGLLEQDLTFGQPRPILSLPNSAEILRYLVSVNRLVSEALEAQRDLAQSRIDCKRTELADFDARR